MEKTDDKQIVQTIIADDHELTRIGLKVSLHKSGRYKVLAEAQDGNELIEILQDFQHQKKNIDLILLDIDMPNKNGIQSLQEIKKIFPSVKVVIITMHHEKFMFKQCMILGANGFINKNESPDNLMQILDQVIAGNMACSAKYESLVFDADDLSETPFGTLTKRELELLYFLIGGYSNVEIAETLDIKVTTVEYHKKNIKEKLDAESTADLIHLAYRYNILENW